MSDEELIAELRSGDDLSTRIAAADRLEALTQSSGKVSDEQVERAARAIYVNGNCACAGGYDACWVKDEEGCCRSAARAALEAAQLPARPKVKSLCWTVSEVFGARKIRGSGPFGEWCAFTIDRLTDQEVSEKKAKYQAGYERTILSALEAAQLPARPVVSEDDLNSFKETVRRIIDGSFYLNYDRDTDALGPLRRILSALEGEGHE